MVKICLNIEITQSYQNDSEILFIGSQSSFYKDIEDIISSSTDLEDYYHIITKNILDGIYQEIISIRIIKSLIIFLYKIEKNLPLEIFTEKFVKYLYEKNVFGELSPLIDWICENDVKSLYHLPLILSRNGSLDESLEEKLKENLPYLPKREKIYNLDREYDNKD